VKSLDRIDGRDVSHVAAGVVRGEAPMMRGAGARRFRWASVQKLLTGFAVLVAAEEEPHRTGSRTSPRTFGHFGGAGTFLWVDPEADVALACLTDRDFGGWAFDAWPALSDAVLGELAGGASPPARAR
jgi:CubicO group peptidase (beta-lactamase class C family)